MNRVYYVKPENQNKEYLTEMLNEHPEIMFVSFMGIDIGGNGTDEKIPVELFLEDMETMLKYGIQTDGSSVELQGIATLNNARVDLVPDLESTWFVDYNYEYHCEQNGLPVGSLKIPAFLEHDEKKVCSRSILKRTVEVYKTKMIEIFEAKPELAKSLGFEVSDIDEVVLTSATELELWVNTPDDEADIEELSTSQTLKEQYWKRTHGIVRTVMEKCIVELGKYGLEPEMAHKEVGGIASRVGTTGRLKYVMEQLEIDWKYADAMQCADNEIVAREIIEDLFRSHGLEVTFMAKPLEGVAGNGEHTHFGTAVKLKSGKFVNLFSPADMTKEYLSEIGYGSLMGLLRNYDVVNPFVSSSNDSLNRLKPGFEAPVCVVTSLGHTKEIPSRNRSILAGVIRDLTNPMATRFELRAPNPLSNTYLVLAASYMAMLDGIEATVKSGLTMAQLEKEISKAAGDDSFYLEKDKMYRSEDDVFEHYTEEERVALFGKAPSTVYENIQGLNHGGERIKLLKNGGVFTDALIESYKLVTLDKWSTELVGRIIPNNAAVLRSFDKLHTDLATDLDVINWEKLNSLRVELMKDSTAAKSLFSRIRNAIESGDYETASDLQIEMNEKMTAARQMYLDYKRNII
ncbi:L-glutamine synthetase [Dethiosulfatibacter aminovorans DSM 17477]|uniref:glutamine synthetase n=1 Tax=Dethiosulfatibacter aminovorans DSM 17477 TaxID=1121476 RepID=A0A1M6JHU4_9FIRM|nr:glutamine synthetase [Dethiosulfatibacter aminovorans]SHJ46192.1 L-glutamine synthetase [Dethiosulfatibacter aminovorans DSM 17477]